MFQRQDFSIFPDHLKIAVKKADADLKPFFFSKESDKSIYLFDLHLIRMLSQAVGFSYELLFPEDNGYGRSLPDGNWTGMIGMLQRGEADIAIGALTPTAERNEVVSFTFPYQFTDVTFVTDKPEYLPKSLAIFYPFSWKMWTALIVLLFVMSFCFYIIFLGRYSYQRVLLSTFGSLLEKSIDFDIKSKHTRFAMLSWFIAVLIVSNSYKAVVLAFLTFPSLSGIRTIGDLSEASKMPSFRCTTARGSFIHDALMKSGEESIKSVASCVERSSKMSYELDNFMFNSSYKKALILGRSWLAQYQIDYFISQDAFFLGSAAVAVRKDFCCKDKLESVIHLMTDTGLQQKHEREVEFFAILSADSLEPQDQVVNRYLTLEDLFGAFSILLAGYAFSIIVFLLEISFKKRFNDEKCIEKNNMPLLMFHKILRRM